MERSRLNTCGIVKHIVLKYYARVPSSGAPSLGTPAAILRFFFFRERERGTGTYYCTSHTFTVTRSPAASPDRRRRTRRPDKRARLLWRFCGYKSRRHHPGGLGVVVGGARGPFLALSPSSSSESYTAEAEAPPTNDDVRDAYVTDPFLPWHIKAEETTRTHGGMPWWVGEGPFLGPLQANRFGETSIYSAVVTSILLYAVRSKRRDGYRSRYLEYIRFYYVFGDERSAEEC